MGGTAKRQLLAVVCGAAMLCVASSVTARPVSSLGRIEPLNGVYQLAGPSDLSVVAELRVVEGQMVSRGDVLATLDTFKIRQAELQRAQVASKHARKVLAREQELNATDVISEARLDEAERDVQVLDAEVAAARANLARAQVSAPIGGRVLLIHSRGGERIGPAGLLELGDTSRMYVVAEVYETDIGLVEVGQRASISSPALPHSLSGKVERIGNVIGKSDVLDLDPIARMDSRVVEVFILLDDPEVVSSLTNLQVDVEIGE